ncbi:hypothetical protein LQ948_17450 [Jiella sp. MQZ9-1]|uniref:Uncharacterized protein n=1 Tax=Jiella flava TaxID=2816857 RepID=A0A939G264_9HYPH|nr:hypothetical protein [Jiella flava]MBO0664361.1 hypothetical protein [Jiella flava]MCD2472997.1 hypothetical protein [Jiella flava]
MPILFVCLGFCFVVASQAFAFSQFENDDDSYHGSGGIVAVPLPPLPGSEKDRQGPNLPSDQTKQSAPDKAPNGAKPPSANTPSVPESEGTDEGEVPLSPEDENARDGKIYTPPPANGAARPENGGGATAPLTPPHSTDGRGAANQPPVLPGGDADRPPAASGTAGRSALPLDSDISHDPAKLPAPVREMREKLLAAARSGDIGELRPFLRPGPDGTLLTFANTPADPIAFLKRASGDGQGLETLAIMIDVLNAGYARVEPNGDDEIYVWPYFTQLDLNKLTKPQLVELFQIVTANDYQAMLEFGAYNFYRIGITPDGDLQFFVAGD